MTLIEPRSTTGRVPLAMLLIAALLVMALGALFAAVLGDAGEVRPSTSVPRSGPAAIPAEGIDATG